MILFFSSIIQLEISLIFFIRKFNNSNNIKILYRKEKEIQNIETKFRSLKQQTNKHTHVQKLFLILINILNKSTNNNNDKIKEIIYWISLVTCKLIDKSSSSDDSDGLRYNQVNLFSIAFEWLSKQSEWSRFLVNKGFSLIKSINWRYSLNCSYNHYTNSRKNN